MSSRTVCATAPEREFVSGELEPGGEHPVQPARTGTYVENTVTYLAPEVMMVPGSGRGGFVAVGLTRNHNWSDCSIAQQAVHNPIDSAEAERRCIGRCKLVDLLHRQWSPRRFDRSADRSLLRCVAASQGKAPSTIGTARGCRARINEWVAALPTNQRSRWWISPIMLRVLTIRHLRSVYAPKICFASLASASSSSVGV